MKTTIEMYLDSMTACKDLEKKYHGFEDFVKSLCTEEHQKDEYFELEKLNTDTNFMYLAFAVFELDTTTFIWEYHESIIVFDTTIFMQYLVKRILDKNAKI